MYNPLQNVSLCMQIKHQKFKHNLANTLINSHEFSLYVQSASSNNSSIAPLFKSPKILKIIESAIEYFNKSYVADNKTMMMLETRISDKNTSTRTSHMENTKDIAIRIAHGLGLNETLVGIIARYHDIGHTPLGHDGERYLSDVRENLGLGPYYHPSLGSYRLIFEFNIYPKILYNIKKQCPELNKEELEEIKNCLWIIMDGINSHTGETAQLKARYSPNKQEEDFLVDQILGFVDSNYRAVPATPEGLVVQQADKISSIITDFTDAIYEGFLPNPGPEYFDILNKLGVSKELYDYCIQKKDCRLIVERVQDFLIQDTINTTKKYLKSHYLYTKKPLPREKFIIGKSAKISTLLNELRNLNYKETVAHVVLQEDKEIYTKGIQKLVEYLKDFTLSEDISAFLKSKSSSNTSQNYSSINLTSEQQNFEDYATFLQQYNKNLHRFHTIITNEALKHCQIDELQLSKKLFFDNKGEAFSKSEAFSIPVGKKGKTKTIDKKYFNKKYSRIESMINYYYMHNLHKEIDPETNEEKLFITDSNGNNIAYSDSDLIAYCESNHLYPSKREALAYQLSTSYIASLNAEQLLRLFITFNIIKPNQYESLTRKYKQMDLEAILAESYKDEFFQQQARRLREETEQAKKSTAGR